MKDSIWAIIVILLMIVLTAKINSKENTLPKAEETIRIENTSCNSNSMGTLIECSYKIMTEDLKNNTKPILGEIYIYENEGKRIIHRLIACINNCTEYIFKGDNNIIADKPVKREQIKQKLIAIYFKN